MIVSPRRLKALGIVGMNDRNINLIAEYNDRRLYPLVDDKLQTKLLATDKGIATPHLLGALRTQHDLRDLRGFLSPFDGFAVKPAKGSGGKGILVIAGRKDDGFVKANGADIHVSDIRRHISNVLSGLFSLAGVPDVAVVEALIRPDDIYRDLSVEGVPDIRVIVYTAAYR